MGIKFTGQAEQERVAKGQELRKQNRWEYLITTSLVEALNYAYNHGWRDNKVQVKSVQLDYGEYEYSVEPYEVDCNCPNILKYSHYFGSGDDPLDIIEVQEKVK